MLGACCRLRLRSAPGMRRGVALLGACCRRRFKVGPRDAARSSFVGRMLQTTFQGRPQGCATEPQQPPPGAMEQGWLSCAGRRAR